MRGGRRTKTESTAPVRGRTSPATRRGILENMTLNSELHNTMVMQLARNTVLNCAAGEVRIVLCTVGSDAVKHCGQGLRRWGGRRNRR